MDQDTTFRYHYSAKENREVQEIRKKYLPQEETLVEELKRLDNAVQSAGAIESLCAGIGGALVFGLGMCLVMQGMEKGVMYMGMGVLLGMLGMVGMIAAYPVYRKVFGRTKQKYTTRILELSAELIGEKN